MSTETIKELPQQQETSPLTTNELNLVEELEQSLEEDVTCECVHKYEEDIFNCDQKAVWRCYWECEESNCPNHIDNILLCNDCKNTWVEQEGDNNFKWERL